MSPRGLPRRFCRFLEVRFACSAQADGLRLQKFTKYARVGVPRYWIVDPVEQPWKRIGLEEKTCAVEAAQTVGSTCAPPGFLSGVELRMDELFAPLPEGQKRKRPGLGSVTEPDG